MRRGISAGLRERSPQVHGVDQVAVVRYGDLAQRSALVRGLGIRPRRRARRRVPDVADRETTAEAGENRLVEDLCDEAELFVDDDRAAVGDRYPSRLLTPMLECIKGVVREPGYVLARRIDADDATGVTYFSRH